MRGNEKRERERKVRERKEAIKSVRREEGGERKRAEVDGEAIIPYFIIYANAPSIRLY